MSRRSKARGLLWTTGPARPFRPTSRSGERTGPRGSFWASAGPSARPGSTTWSQSTPTRPGSWIAPATRSGTPLPRTWSTRAHRWIRWPPFWGTKVWTPPGSTPVSRSICRLLDPARMCNSNSRMSMMFLLFDIVPPECEFARKDNPFSGVSPPLSSFRGGTFWPQIAGTIWVNIAGTF